MKTKIKIEWDYRDILITAKDYGYIITKKQACEVLADIEATYDACIGITWDTIAESVCNFATENNLVSLTLGKK
jgi:hypothetical protein